MVFYPILWDFNLAENCLAEIEFHGTGHLAMDEQLGLFLRHPLAQRGQHVAQLRARDEPVAVLWPTPICKKTQICKKKIVKRHGTGALKRLT
jgi:hypothetical protein